MTEDLEYQAFLYASGAMDKPERDEFETRLERDLELRDFTRRVLDLTTEWRLEKLDLEPKPSAALKERLMSAVDEWIGRTELFSVFAGEESESMVFTDRCGLVVWASPAFSSMCGYGLTELRGKKLGKLLQGPETDPLAVERMRSAIRAGQACREELLNYHKCGRPYRVQISISPVLDNEGAPRGFLAIERELIGA
jgi:PAS domain S-box-containing protein